MPGQRPRLLDEFDGAYVDVAIIGGGINGAVTAAALTGAGVRTALVDRGDFSSFLLAANCTEATEARFSDQEWVTRDELQAHESEFSELLGLSSTLT